MPATVVLEHTLPDGSSHFDWMIEDPTLDGEYRLATWRLAVRPDRAEVGRVFEAERIGAHRARYLRYEGPLSDGRGDVRRVAEGSAEWAAEWADPEGGAAGGSSDEVLWVHIEWSDGWAGLYTGRTVDGRAWSWSRDLA